MEVEEARKGHTNVGQRLDNFDSQLETIEIKKATKQEVDGIAREVVGARKTYTNVGARLNDFDSQLEDFDLQLNTKAKQIDLEVEKARIDSLTKLSNGSTTGDAELIDARIGE